MPDPFFSHPDTTATVVWTTGVVSPATIEWTTNQSWQLSDAGIPQVYRFGPVIAVWIFGFANVPLDTYEDLLTFFNDPVINWRGEPFQYTDEAGAASWVQLLDERLQVQHRAIGTYDLGMRLLHRTDLETP